MALQGQNLRIFIGGKAIAAALDCTIHIGTTQDDATTKDSTGDWDEIEITGKNWDISFNSLYSTETGTALGTTAILAMLGQKLTVKFDETSGDKNRTAANTFSHTGEAYLVDASIQAANRQKVQGSWQLKGTGPLN